MTGKEPGKIFSQGILTICVNKVVSRFDTKLRTERPPSLREANGSCRKGGGRLHQVLSAQCSEQFGQDYGVWLKEWRLFQRAIFALDRANHIVYAEYVVDQLGEPDYLVALQAVRQAVLA